MKRLPWILCGLACVLFGAACRQSPAVVALSLSGLTMGTTYQVQAIPPSPRSPSEGAVRQAVEEELEGVNRSMSMFRPDSELSSFNRNTDTGWFAVSPAVAEVVTRALEVSALSQGAFDVTVAPLVDLWGFGRKGPAGRPPAPEEVGRVLQEIGYSNLEARRQPPALRKKRPALSCDLSAIAKGYAVDRVAERLSALGFESYLVEIGGEVRARGQNAENRDWQIGIAAPDSSGGLGQVVHLKNTSVATSGDYRNYFEKDGRRYSHTIDPQTGSPITHALASVTVIHPSCTHADALATALNVLGPERGMALAVQEKLPVQFILRQNGRFVVQSTEWFAPYLTR